MKPFLLQLIFLVILGHNQLFAQHLERYCGHDQLLKQTLIYNPEFKDAYEGFLAQALNEHNPNRFNDTVYKVQVVFHILYKAGDPYQNVSDELIYSQLDALNRDYNMRNADTSDTRDIFKPFAGNAKIEFVLAKRKPNGNCANAIIRKEFDGPNNLLPIFSDFLIKDDFWGGSTAWDTKKYLNIWVLDLNKGRNPEDGFLGGYAYFPEMTPLKYNGVVLDYRFFGQNNPYITDVLPAFSRYAKGRACVHEVGHWFGLRHIWGDLGTIDPDLGCTADDGIDDTPNAATAYSTNGFCADTIVNSCLDEPIDYPDMFENYMDYSSDDCQSMFTKQQVAVMRETFVSVRAGLNFEEVTNNTETIYSDVTEKDSGLFCFELGDCFGFGNFESHFCDGDSIYTSAMGHATFNSAQNCINYVANTYNENLTEDVFCVVVYDEHLQTSDTTIFNITINEICPKTDTIYIEASENSTFETCIDSDPCLDVTNYTLTLCDGSSTYQTDELQGVITDDCINFTASAFNPDNHQKKVCLIANYTSGEKDTTLLIIDINSITSVNTLSLFDKAFIIYPNPNEGLFTIKKNGNITENVIASIINATGKQIRKFNIKKGDNEVAVDISAYPKGIYILMLKSENNTSFKKIVLQ